MSSRNTSRMKLSGCLSHTCFTRVFSRQVAHIFLKLRCVFLGRRPLWDIEKRSSGAILAVSDPIRFRIDFLHRFWSAPGDPQEPPKTAQEGPRAPQGASQDRPGGPKSVPRGPTSTPRPPQEGPRGSEIAPRSPKIAFLI